MEDQLMRIGVSIPSRLLSAFDNVINERGYSSRSEAIRDAIRGYLLDYESLGQAEGEQIGVVTLVYNHEQRGLISLLTDIQHENAKIITSTVHIHLDATNCLEIDVVHGSATDISGFAEKMMIQSGVFQVRTFVIPTLSLANSDQNANNAMSVGYDDMRPDSRNCQLKTQKKLS